MATPTRSTSEQELDRWNAEMRASKVYQDFMRSIGNDGSGRVKLSRSQQTQLEQALTRAGAKIPSGMHIDQGGNLNQKNRLGRNVAIGAAATGAALTGFGLAGMGPFAGLAGASAPAVVGGTGLPTLASTTYPALATTAPSLAGVTTLGGLATVPTIASRTIGPTADAVTRTTRGATDIANSVTGKDDGGVDWRGLFGDNWEMLIPTITNAIGGVMGSRAANEAAQIQADAAKHAADRQYQATQDTLAMMRDQWGQQQENQRPWLETGKGALLKLSDLVGVTPQGVQQTPQSAPMGLASMATGSALRSIPAGTSVPNGGIAGGGMDVRIGGPNPTQVPTQQTVMMMAPNGERQAVPAHLVDAYRQKGAQVIS